MKKKLHVFCLLAACAAALPPLSYCGWERVRSSDAPLAVVSASTGTYDVSYTVGDGCASPSMLSAAASSVWSGYLSLVPAEAVAQGLTSLSSTSSAVSSDGALWGLPSGGSLGLVFSDDISPDLSAPGVNVTQLYDNAGSVSGSSWPVTLSYSGQELVLVPSESWPKGSVFSVYFSSGIVDINGSPLTEATTVYFSVIMDHRLDNTAAALSDRRVRVTIPANSYSQDFFMAVSTGVSGQAAEQANARLPALPGSPELLSAVSVSPYDASGRPAQPNSACVITLPYPDASGDGLIDGPPSAPKMKVSSLSVWRLNETSALWERQGGAVLDTAARTVSQPVTHFSDYALMAVPDNDVSSVYASPVPFRPNGGDMARYGSWSGGIMFRGIPSSAVIRIYTITGALVRTLYAAPPSVVWDVKNADGQIVASGVYLWEARAGKNRKTGKLVVIK